MIEAVLCDIDGTLVQKQLASCVCLERAFAQLGIDVPLEDVRTDRKRRAIELIPVFVPWWKRDAVKDIESSSSETISEPGQTLPYVNCFNI